MASSWLNLQQVQQQSCWPTYNTAVQPSQAPKALLLLSCDKQLDNDLPVDGIILSDGDTTD
jgi:hypothetical protein